MYSRYNTMCSRDNTTLFGLTRGGLKMGTYTTTANEVNAYPIHLLKNQGVLSLLLMEAKKKTFTKVFFYFLHGSKICFHGSFFLLFHGRKLSVSFQVFFTLIIM